MLTLDVMRQMWPHGNQHVPGLIEGIVASAPDVCARYGITDNRVLAHCMGQFSLECGAGTEMVENLNYSAGRIREVWPSRASAAAYAHNPQGLANAVYNGRMGNRLGSNDGWNYRGRGLPQTTGADEYRAVTVAVRKFHPDAPDFLANPDMVNDPKWAFEVGIANFVKCGCLSWAKADNIEMVTRRLNGGLTGLSDRVTWTNKWKKALANTSWTAPQPHNPRLDQPAPAPKQPPPSVGDSHPLLHAVVSLVTGLFGRK